MRLKKDKNNNMSEATCPGKGTTWEKSVPWGEKALMDLRKLRKAYVAIAK